MQADASLVVNHEYFPSVVCESGWADKMDDLHRDAEIWLLHSYGRTVAVLALVFTENFGDYDDSGLTAGVPDAADDSDDELATHQQASQATADTESSQASSDSPSEEASSSPASPPLPPSMRSAKIY